MKLKIIKEGNIKIKVPVEEELTRKMSVFYNPEMKFDRDLSELIVSVLKPKKICDCLAASGVRGLRYANVLEKGVCKDNPTNCPEVVLNDTNPNAVKLMEKNAKLNSLKIRIENKNANKLLLEEMFDFIDIDPFGSPIYFLDCAAKSIRNRGIVALTATDTAPLCGTSPLTCLRRYGIKSLRTDFSKELGLRILISSTIRHFAKYDMAFNPIFSYCRRHYFRVFGKIERGCKRADALLKQFDYISYCQKCGFRKSGIFGKCENCGNKLNRIGKIYLGDFASQEFCNKLLKESEGIAMVDKFLPIGVKENGAHPSTFIRKIRDEQNFPFYFDVHKICKLNKKPIKKNAVLLEELEGRRTHFSETGIKTKKGFEEILKALD